VRNMVEVPVLRKDFVIDEFQIYEGRAAGADAILLIVAALTDDQLGNLHTLITELGMAALVEVHNEVEMERALKSGAALIGINNRDLKTFGVSLDVTARLAKLVPDNVILVAESGIASASDVHQMGMLGAHAVLVGEALVRAGDGLDKQVREFSTQPRIPVNGR
jgi:indole-3-glycerol phosphate synthase